MRKEKDLRNCQALTTERLEWMVAQRQERHSAALEIARAVKQARKIQRISQAQLALMIGSTQPSLSRLERGRVSDVGVQMLQRIGTALGMETVVVFRASDECS